MTEVSHSINPQKCECLFLNHPIDVLGNTVLAQAEDMKIILKGRNVLYLELTSKLQVFNPKCSNTKHQARAPPPVLELSVSRVVWKTILYVLKISCSPQFGNYFSIINLHLQHKESLLFPTWRISTGHS